MKLVYVAGPLGARGPKPQAHMEYLQNIYQMINTGTKLIRKFGVAVVIPGLDILLPLVNPWIIEEELKQNSLELLKRCDAIFVLDFSPGVKKEIKLAKKMGIPVLYDFEELLMFLEKESEKEGGK